MSLDQFLNSLNIASWEAALDPFRFTFVSGSDRALFGYSAEDWTESNDFRTRTISPSDLKVWQEAIASLSAENQEGEVCYKFLMPNGQYAWVQELFSVHFSDDGTMTLRGVTIDVTQRVNIEDALRLVIEVSAEAAEHESIDELARGVLEKICQLRNWNIGQGWFLDEEENLLVCSSRAFYSDTPVEEFRNDSLARTFKKGVGLPGRVWATMSPAWISDCASDTNFPRKPVAERDEIKAGFAFPIRHGQKLFAVFEFFAKEIRVPDPYLLGAIDKLGSHLSDVFERLKAESELRAQREEQQVIFDAMPAMLWYKDATNRILRVNRAAADSIGLPVDQIEGRSTYDLYPDEANKYHQDDMHVIVTGKPLLGIIEQVLTSSGEKIWVRTDKIPYRDHNGKTLGVIVFAVDITETKKAEAELQLARDELEDKVEERTKQLTEANIFFDLSRDLLCIAGVDGYFKRLNPAWQSTLGYTVEELLARPYISFVHPDDIDRTLMEAKALSRGVPTIAFENRYFCKDGSIKWLLWSATTSESEPSLIYAIAHDITGRKETETELEELSTRFKNLSKHVPGVIYQYLQTADGKISFPYISEGCNAIFEYGQEELMRDASLAILSTHPDDLPGMYRAIAESASTLSQFTYESRIVTKSGKLRWVQASSTPERLANGDTLWNGLIMDITELKTAEEKIRQLNEDLAQRVSILAAVNQELEILTHKLELAYDEALEASKLKSEFVANISHEVRTPISAVIGMSELLLDTPLSAEQRGYAKIVSESAQSLLTIINDILDFSKVEAGRIELETIDFNILSIVEGCADWLASAARARRLSLITFVDPNIPLYLRGDPVRVRQVLLNLASNAIKFTDAGEVVLRATQEDEDDDSVLIKFEVRDTGIGISEGARNRLFQPFAQADGSTTRKYGGTGLGLSISKRLVELMHGSIDVESSEGIGSNFWFTVPFARSTLMDLTMSHTDMLSTLSDIHVLVCIDNDTERGVIISYLEHAGIKAEESVNASKAMELLQRKSKSGRDFEAIIVDLNDARADSFTFSRRLLDEAICPGAAILLLTHFDDREKNERALISGVASCLHKPIRQSHLIESIIKVVTRQETQEDALAHGEHEKPPLKLGTQHGMSDKVILLAEDNPVLQELAHRQLKKLGLTVRLAANGRQVLDALGEQKCALILMDCQMPEMDGFETTMNIRKDEAVSGGHIPIIAMTASAMPSDREHCLTAGMDDYLSKPVSQGQLTRLLEKWLPLHDSEAEPGVPRPPLPEPEPPPAEPRFTDSDSTPVDIKELAHLYGEDGLNEILSLFIVEAADLLKTTDRLLEEKNDRELAACAHQLKGLAAVMSARQLGHWSLAIEQAAKKSAWDQAHSARKELEKALISVTNFVESFLASKVQK